MCTWNDKCYSIGLLDHENIGINTEIKFLCALEVELLPKLGCLSDYVGHFEFVITMCVLGMINVITLDCLTMKTLV